MGNQRMILLLALGFIGLLIWQAWQEDYGERPPGYGQGDGYAAAPTADGAPGDAARPPATAAGEPPTAATPPADIAAPAADAPADDELPTLSSASSLHDMAPQGQATPATPDQPPQNRIIRVITDKLAVAIDPRGGEISAVSLRDYPVALDQPDQPFPLLAKTARGSYVARSGLLSRQPAPTHQAQFTADKTEYRMRDDADTLRVPLRWTDGGIDVAKTLIFTRATHVVDVEYTVANRSQQPWQGRQYREITRTPAADRSGIEVVTYTFNGAAYYSAEDKFEKIHLDDIADDPLEKDVTGGWVGMIEHYFLSAWIPDKAETNNFYTRAISGDRYAIGMISPQIAVPPGAEGVFKAKFYAGPKIQSALAQLAEGLDLSVDYSWLTIIAKPIFWLMTFLHDNVVGNWGWVIILLTLVIKLALFKLSEYGYRSMANMRKLQPKLVSMKERYGGDKQRMQQAMMALYKKEKINPMSGCFPILLQIPVFIALYWVLLESVELRHAPFILWIEDLSAKDPFFVLPIIMGATMVFQQRLNPAPMDEMQQTIMKVLPIVFTVFFLFFPAGLVLYWVVNNVLSIAQQWVITRRIERGEDKAAQSRRGK